MHIAGVSNEEAIVTSTVWWLPENSDSRVSGNLIEEPEGGWVLELDGTFEEESLGQLAEAARPRSMPLSLPRGFPVVLGVPSQGRWMSLLDCQVLGGAPAMPGLTRGWLNLSPRIIAYGVHFESLDDFRLRSLAITYSDLDEWVSTSGFSVAYSQTPYPVTVTYTKPQNIEVVLDDRLTIGLGFSAQGPRRPAMTEVHISQQSWIRATADVPRPYEELAGAVQKLANLIALGVGHSLRPAQVQGECEAENDNGPEMVSIDIVHNREPLAPRKPEVPGRNMLFTLPDIRSRLDKIVTAWFAQGESLQSLYDLYFGTIRSPFMYVEHRLLNMFQALESYHRRSIPSVKSPSHEERLARILANFSGKDRTWLKKALRWSHEPTAADRIRELRDGIDAQWLLSDQDIELAAKLRNYHIHFDLKGAEDLPPKERRVFVMINLAAKLRVLCELILLDACGLPRNHLKQRIAETRRLDHLTIPIEPEATPE